MLLFSNTNIFAAAALYVMLSKVVFTSLMIEGLNYIFNISSFILTKFCLAAAYPDCFVILLPLGMFVDQVIGSL